MPGVERNVISLIREQVKTLHEYLEGTMEEVTTEEAHWIPPKSALPIGATYAHVITGEDAIVNGMFRGQAPLFASSFAAKTGLSEPPPAPDPKKPGFPDWGQWARTVKVDLPKIRAYAQAVYAATDEYLGRLRGKDLDRTLDLSALGLGENSVLYVINNGILGNGFTHTGEIACLKGLQGKKGYPF
ncbi:MAG: hypothetical protein Kow00128_09070 [Deltaproteobacteria bacterium]